MHVLVLTMKKYRYFTLFVACVVFVLLLGFYQLYGQYEPKPIYELTAFGHFRKNYDNVSISFMKKLGIKNDNVDIIERTRSTVIDLSKYIRSETRNIRELKEDVSKIKAVLERLENFSGEFISYLELNIETLETTNGILEEKKLKLQNITRIVQKRIAQLQNDPANCVPDKVILCELTNLAGFASGIHDALSCFVEAYYSGRRVVLDNSKWHYTPKRAWTSVGFRPLTDACQDDKFKKSTETKGLTGNGDACRKSLNRFPTEVKDQLLETGVDPLGWRWGQFVGYIMRPNEKQQKIIQNVKKKLQFIKPIVGLQIRRSDKVNSEARFHGNEVYMREVERYYDKLDMTQKGTPRNVFIATDDPSAISDLKRDYPAYNFISQKRISELAKNPKTRYNSESLTGLLIDLYLLADCNYLICTMSSGFCRLAFELSSYYKSTSSDLNEIEVHPTAFSLDVPLHYTYILPPKRVVIIDHLDSDADQLTALVGDVLHTTDQFFFQNEAMKGKLEDGFGVWNNTRTGEIGRIPHFKTKEVFENEGDERPEC